MLLCAGVRLGLLLGAVLFAATGICTNSDAFEEMHDVDDRVYNRGIDHLPALANRLLARDVVEATLTLNGSPVATTNLALDSTQALTSVVTEIKCARCNPETTKHSSEPDPTVSETTSKKPTDPVTATEKSTAPGTTGGKSTVSVTTTEQTTTPVAPTEESSCSSFPTDPTTGPIPVPTEVPSCSAGPTEPTTGPIPAPTEKSTIPGTETGKPTCPGAATGKTSVSGSDTETSCSAVPTEPTTGPIPAPTDESTVSGTAVGEPTAPGTATEKTTVSGSDTETSCSAVPVSTKAPTQPSVGEHPGVPPTSTHIEVTIPITPGQGGPNTLSTRITLATSKGGSGVPTPSELSTPLRSTGENGFTTATSHHSEGSGAGSQVTKHTGEAAHTTASPSPTYNGGTSLKKNMSYSLAAGILLAFFIGFL